MVMCVFVCVAVLISGTVFTDVFPYHRISRSFILPLLLFLVTDN